MIVLDWKSNERKSAFVSVRFSDIRSNQYILGCIAHCGVCMSLYPFIYVDICLYKRFSRRSIVVCIVFRCCLSRVYYEHHNILTVFSAILLACGSFTENWQKVEKINLTTYNLQENDFYFVVYNSELHKIQCQLNEFAQIASNLYGLSWLQIGRSF